MTRLWLRPLPYIANTIDDGVTVGATDEGELGVIVGWNDGAVDSSVEGFLLGVDEAINGNTEGLLLGAACGLLVGTTLGLDEGTTDGFVLGVLLGRFDGPYDGDAVVG